MKTLLLAAAVAALSIGSAQAAPKSSDLSTLEGPQKDERVLVEMRGGYNYYGAGPNYYMQQHPGPNCYAYPHPVYGWICY
ncbi:MAG: hypothetical protein KIT16_07375 [Rhodospirillaceae bacterium]|nr:hypothetical protein [Rhodospirillaceae bacterium]